MTINWDSKADAKLMSAFTQTGSVDYEAVARFMGDGCTVSAVKHRIARLRDKAGIANPRGGRKSSGTPKKGAASSASTASGASASTSSKNDANTSSPLAKKKSSVTSAGRHKRAGSGGPVHGGRGMKLSSKTSSAGSTDDEYSGSLKQELKDEEEEPYFEA